MSSSVSVPALLLDVALGLWAADSGVPASEWRSWCRGRAAVRYMRAARLARRDGDGDSVRALLAEMVLFDGLADCLPADEMVARAGTVLARFDDDGVVVPVPSAMTDGLVAWHYACPQCVDDTGFLVPLDYDGRGDWSCPRCGCHTTSPVDDACPVLDGLDGDGLCSDVLAASVSASPSECVRRASECWRAVDACESAGMWSDVLRYIVRAALWEWASYGWDADELPGWLSSCVDDAVEHYGPGVLSCPMGHDCVRCVLGGACHD